MVIADVSAQAVGGVERAVALSAGVSLHGLAEGQRELLVTGSWKALTARLQHTHVLKKPSSTHKDHQDFGVPPGLSPAG